MLSHSRFGRLLAAAFFLASAFLAPLPLRAAGPIEAPEIAAAPDGLFLAVRATIQAIDGESFPCLRAAPDVRAVVENLRRARDSQTGAEAARLISAKLAWASFTAARFNALSRPQKEWLITHAASQLASESESEAKDLLDSAAAPASDEQALHSRQAAFEYLRGARSLFLARERAEALGRARVENSAALARGAVATAAKQWRAAFPETDVAYQETDRWAGGGSGGRWITDLNGRYYFAKTGDPDWLAGQHLAMKLYRLFGVSTPLTNLESIRGEPHLISREVPGWLAGSLPRLARTDVKDGFVVDAWLGNWDVLGDERLDNVLADGGKARRIDTGGALLWRGSGPRKDSFDAAVTELRTMRDPRSYPTGAGRFFKRLGDAHVAQQIRKFKDAYAKNRTRVDALIDGSGLSPAAREEVRRALHARADWLATEGLATLAPDTVVGNEREKLESLFKVDNLPSDPTAQGVRADFEQAAQLRLDPAKKDILSALSDEEVAVLDEYVGGGFQALNKALWEKDSLDRPLLRPFIALLKSGLGKLPGYGGVVYRWDSTEHQPWTTFRNSGKTITARGFWSSSRSLFGAPYGGDIVFKILSKSGKRLDFLNEGEDEVLFDAGTRFRVLKREIISPPDDPDRRIRQVVLEEL